MLNTEQQQKAINALLKRAENILCADCNAKSPCWASLDFGVFVCMNCSGAHRALGPSVTRVKSTKLDTWNRQWLQNMQVGNSVLNEYWQSQLTGLNRTQKPNVNTPLNQIIKFVHNKYVKRKYVRTGEPIDPLKKQKTNQALKPKVQKQKEPVSPLINTVKAAKQSDLLSFNASIVVPKKESPSVVSNLINFQGEVSAPKQNNLLSFQDLTTNASKPQSQNLYSQPVINNIPPSPVQQNNGSSITFDHLLNNYNKPQSHNNHFFNGNQVNQPNYYPPNHYQNHYSMQHAFHSISHNSHSLSHPRTPSDNTIQHKQVLVGGNGWKNDSTTNGKITLEANLDWNGQRKQKQTVSSSWTDQWK